MTVRPLCSNDRFVRRGEKKQKISDRIGIMYVLEEKCTLKNVV